MGVLPMGAILSAMSSLRADPGGQFDSDEHRRVCGYLTVPRPLNALVREVATDATLRTLPENGLLEVLRDLEQDGLVKSIGSFADGQQLVEAVGTDSGARSLADETAENIVAASARQPERYLLGEQRIITDKGYDLLTGPVADEPTPLEGDRLTFAEQQDEAIVERNEEVIVENRTRAVENLRAAADKIEAGDDDPSIPPEDKS